MQLLSLDLKSFATSTCNLNPLSRQLDSNHVNSWTCRIHGRYIPIHSHSQNCMTVKIWNRCIKRNLHDYPHCMDTFQEYRECASGHARSHGTGQTFATGKPIKIMCCCMSKLGPFSLDRMNAEFLYCSWKSIAKQLWQLDALSVLCKGHHQYTFTPFVLNAHCLSKLQDQLSGDDQGYHNYVHELCHTIYSLSLIDPIPICCDTGAKGTPNSAWTLLLFFITKQE